MGFSISSFFGSPKPAKGKNPSGLVFHDEEGEVVLVDKISSYGHRTFAWKTDSRHVFVYTDEDTKPVTFSFGDDEAEVRNIFPGGTFFVAQLKDSSLHSFRKYKCQQVELFAFALYSN